MILIMTVNPGFGGQRYIPAMTEKIRQLRKLLNDRGLKKDIQVDGGVDQSNAASIIEAGANVLVSGSKIFNGDIEKNVSDFREIMAKYSR